MLVGIYVGDRALLSLLRRTPVLVGIGTSCSRLRRLNGGFARRCFRFGCLASIGALLLKCGLQPIDEVRFEAFRIEAAVAELLRRASDYGIP